MMLSFMYRTLFDCCKKKPKIKVNPKASNNLIESLVNHFSIPEEVFKYSEFFEEKILEHVLWVNKDTHIPHPSKGTKNAMFFCITHQDEEYIAINYPSLSKQHLESIIAGYKKAYGDVCKIQYQYNFRDKPIDIILFHKETFLDKVLMQMQLTLQDKFLYQRDKSKDKTFNKSSSTPKITQENLTDIHIILLITLIEEKFNAERVCSLYNSDYPNCVALTFSTLIEIRDDNGNAKPYYEEPLALLENIDPTCLSRKVDPHPFSLMVFVFDPIYIKKMIHVLQLTPTPHPDEKEEIENRKMLVRC